MQMAVSIIVSQQRTPTTQLGYSSLPLRKGMATYIQQRTATTKLGYSSLPFMKAIRGQMG